jgi:hypothetical protein
MRWFLRSLAALALLWAIFVASPYVALYDLARAAQARDLAAIEKRVDFAGLRRSLARQIAASYAKAVGGERGPRTVERAPRPRDRRPPERIPIDALAGRLRGGFSSAISSAYY